jgi:RimJ/RimL family protein N-acetyltransferase
LSDARLEFPVEGLSDGVVRLRPMADGDVDAVVAACQDPEIPRWTRVPTPYGEAEARAWLAEQGTRRDAGSALELVVVEEESGELVGSVAIADIVWQEGRADLGYWVAKGARGQGIATRAVGLLARWALESLPIDRLQICAEPENAASRRVAERCGFTFEGVLRSFIVNKGTRRDMAMYSLLRAEVAQGQGPKRGSYAE